MRNSLVEFFYRKLLRRKRGIYFVCLFVSLAFKFGTYIGQFCDPLILALTAIPFEKIPLLLTEKLSYSWEALLRGL